ncbi:MFS transporter [Aquihabitans sp. G128]|uniref:MFS transporter n=1 Tax=Aquihabitans sp. G128 TaxID=2849779 RepID=UPI001C2186C6|nr:MFS transporter [Aquihabitans sp. G128]QXC61495.1 MFS transporter [Aquihabitans sp. G128]
MTTTTPPSPPVDGDAAPADTSTFRSLHVRNFRLFFIGQLISQTGTWLTMVTQTLLVLHLTKSGIALGLLTAFQFGPVLLLGAWAGAVADRADKRTLLMTVQALAMVQSVALGIVVLAGWATVPAIFALAAVQGVLTAFDNPARRSFVVEMVPPEDLSNAVSLNSAVMTGSRVVGPAAAGALVLGFGYGWPFVIDAVTYLAVLAGLFMMRPDELFRTAPMAKAKGQVREGLRYIRSNAQLYVPLVMMAIIGTLAFNFSVTIPLLVNGPLHGDNTTFTLLFSVLSLGSLVGALITARRTVVTSRQLVISAAAFGITMLGLAAAPHLALAFPAAILMGLASIAFMTSSTAIVQLLAGPEYRGRVLAIQGMVFLGSTPIGGPLVGWIADVAGPRTGIAVGGVACLVAAVYGAKALHLPLHADGGIDPLATEELVLDDESVALAD